jgi:hypothetical protein
VDELYKAVRGKDHTAVVRLLSVNPVDVHFPYSNDCTPLEWAVEHGAKKCLRVLLEHEHVDRAAYQVMQHIVPGQLYLGSKHKLTRAAVNGYRANVGRIRSLERPCVASVKASASACFTAVNYVLDVGEEMGQYGLNANVGGSSGEFTMIMWLIGHLPG